ncbi:MAG: hypothetical protein ABI876_05995 [Bacteroidota bacterium]
MIATIRTLLASCIAATLVISACGERKTPDAPRPDSARAVAPAAPSAAPAPHIPAGNDIDTTDGTITATGTGTIAGTWKLNDMTATMDEQPMNGVTLSVLTIQAHDGIAARHLRFRLTRENAPIETGIYSIESPSGTPPRKLDARFEWGQAMFTSIHKAKGTVTVRSLKGDRATGSFDVTLASMETGEPETLKGDFDLKFRH